MNILVSKCISQCDACKMVMYTNIIRFHVSQTVINIHEYQCTSQQDTGISVPIDTHKYRHRRRHEYKCMCRYLRI